MKLVQVIPISRGISKEVLSYFTTSDVPLGSLVEVDLRKRKIKGLVIGSEDAEAAKGKIRSADFAIKKIEKIDHHLFLSPAFIRAARQTAEYFSSTTGAVLNALIPKAVLEDPKVLESASRGNAENNCAVRSETSHPEGCILQDSRDDRFATYRSMVREAFARKKSIFFLIPTHQDGLDLRNHLERGIENRVVFLTSALSKKKLLENLGKLKSESHPILIIGTAQFLFLPREDLKTIIVENESSRAYKSIGRPFIDYRHFAERLATENKIEFILADQYLRIETLGRYDSGELIECSPLKFRPESMSKEILIDMRQYRTVSGASFRVLSDELLAMIEKLPKKGERMFIFSARRGLAPSTLCADCGTIVICHNCGAPVVLHKSKKDEKENFFLCHHCGEKRSALERCQNCGGWRLTSLGIGIEKVEEEIKKKFPHISLFRLDKEKASTDKKARDMMKKFYSTPGSILLGTEMALSYQRQTIEYSAIASMDSLFSIPDFHINERIFHILLQQKSVTEKEFLIQTRNPEQTALKQFLEGRFSEFYREELKAREKFGYPPFKVLIKISLEGKKPVVSREVARLENIFEDYQPFVFPAFIGVARGNIALHILIKIDRRNWPNEDLSNKLSSLSPNFTIRINPDSLL